MSQPKLILASGSPRRRQLLAEAGYCFEVLPARDGVEDRAESQGLCSGCGPAELVADLSLVKGLDVMQQVTDRLAQGLATGPHLIIAADTLAECGGQPLGKPADADHARQMMQQLSGRAHRVYTGLFLGLLPRTAETAPATERHVVETTLEMSELTPEWIESYVESGKWEGKAGGFGYQDGLGFVHITEGSESNVVGLPMELVAERLTMLGCQAEA